MEWISVEDRLPELHETVVLFSSRDGIGLGARTSDGSKTSVHEFLRSPNYQWWYKRVNEDCVASCITHWKLVYPLPGMEARR